MKRPDSGFTLIELMVAMAMSSIIVGVIYSAYTIQTKIYTEQDKVAEMQQNLRAGMAFLQREARMAGYNPKDKKHVSCDAPGAGAKSVAPGIHTATATTFGFSMDLDEDGKCTSDGENVTYTVYTSGGVSKLGRNDNTDAQPQQPIAENITNIDFVFMARPPRIGTPVSKPPTQDPFSAANNWKSSDIVAVQVALLARAKQPDRKATANETFNIALPDAYGESQAGGTTWGPFTDSYSRRLLTSTVNCRNMGL